MLGNGEYRRKSILNTEENDLSLTFRYGRQTSVSELIVASERRGELKLVKLKY